MSKSISRREAMKNLGGVALGSALFSQPGLAQAQSSPAPKAQPTAQKRHSSSQRPNILWITGEGVPTAALSCYGSQLIKTPNIDRLAHEGMRFENSFTTNALCAPSRATLLTGKYSHMNGMTTNPEDTIGQYTPAHFDATQQTFPKLVKEMGYQTGTVGKWHLPANPGEAGFDYFVFKKGAGGPYYDPNGYLQNPRLGSTEIEHASYPGYETDTVTDLAIKGIQKFKETSDEPFMMMVQFFNDHRPFDPPHKYEHLYDNVRIPEPGTFWDDYSHRAAAAQEARMRIEDMPDYDPPKDLTDRQRKQWNYQQFMSRFLGALHSQDDNIGRLLNFLDESGVAENTVVVYTSDHGFFLGDHGWFDKRFMYEQALRVPLMVRYPGVVKAGSVQKECAVNIDNAPTVLDIAGHAIPAEMQGKSLLPILKGNIPTDWRTSLYYHYYEFASNHWVFPHYGIRTEQYKLIYYYTVNEWELFDLKKDPDEMDNLFEWSGYKVHPAYEKITNNLVAQLQQLRDMYQDKGGGTMKLWPTASYD